MEQTEWEWPIAASEDNHAGRIMILRQIGYELMPPLEDPSAPIQRGKALTLNLSTGGMLVLMDRAPAIEQVLKVKVPTPLGTVETPTLSEVRWSRQVPFGRSRGKGAYLVGLKFLL